MALQTPEQFEAALAAVPGEILHSVAFVPQQGAATIGRQDELIEAINGLSTLDYVGPLVIAAGDQIHPGSALIEEITLNARDLPKLRTDLTAHDAVVRVARDVSDWFVADREMPEGRDDDLSRMAADYPEAAILHTMLVLDPSTPDGDTAEIQALLLAFAENQKNAALKGLHAPAEIARSLDRRKGEVFLGRLVTGNLGEAEAITSSRQYRQTMDEISGFVTRRIVVAHNVFA